MKDVKTGKHLFFKRAHPGLFLFIFVLFNNNLAEKLYTLVGFVLGTSQ